MIIIGYPGIGKSTLASRKQGYIDLESSHFWIENEETGMRERSEGWAQIYTSIAADLSAQGNIVFVSSHQDVQNELAHSKEKVVVICPSMELSEEWVVKLADRFKHTGLDKDFKAWIRAQECIEEDLEQLLQNNGFEIYKIDDMRYNLVQIIEEEIK